jgi:RasGEF domain/RasGEF N-terminal motif
VHAQQDNPTIKELVQSLTGYLDVMSDHKVVDQRQVSEAAGPMGQLVVAQLTKTIHTQLSAVKTLSLQVTCIIRFIATVDIDHVALVQLVATVNAFTVGMRRLLSAVYTFSHIHNSGIVASTETSEDHGSPWEETTALDSIPANQSEPNVGNMDMVVNKLCGPGEIDKNFLVLVTMTFRSFSNPHIFLSKLVARYHTPATVPAAEASAIRKNVGHVLHHWIHKNLSDFDEHMITHLEPFLEEMQQDPVLKGFASTLFKWIEVQIENRKTQRLVWFAQDHHDDIEILQEGISLSDLILEVPAQIISDQLTAIEWKLYTKIEPVELLSQHWSKEATQHLSPNLIAIISRSTRISHWTATMILSQSDAVYRTKMLEKMIELCQCLRAMNNFNTLMGIVAGLNLACVSRLNLAKKKVSSTRVKAFKAIMQSVSPEGSHKLYRQALSEARAPAIPYLAVALMDLTFIDDGNDDEVDGMINLGKAKLTGKNISQLLKFQKKTPFRIAEMEPLYSFVEEMPLLGLDELYNLSLQIEPRAPAGKKEKPLGW